MLDMKAIFVGHLKTYPWRLSCSADSIFGQKHGSSVVLFDIFSLALCQTAMSFYTDLKQKKKKYTLTHHILKYGSSSPRHEHPVRQLDGIRKYTLPRCHTRTVLKEAAGINQTHSSRSTSLGSGANDNSPEDLMNERKTVVYCTLNHILIQSITHGNTFE